MIEGNAQDCDAAQVLHMECQANGTATQIPDRERITRSSPMSALHNHDPIVRPRWTDSGPGVRGLAGTRAEATGNEYGSRHLVLMVGSPLATIATPEPPWCAFE